MGVTELFSVGLSAFGVVGVCSDGTDTEGTGAGVGGAADLFGERIPSEDRFLSFSDRSFKRKDLFLGGEFIFEGVPFSLSSASELLGE